MKHISGSVYHIIIKKKFLHKCGTSIKMDEENKASLLHFRWWRTIGVQASEMAISDLDLKMEINLPGNFSFLGYVYTHKSVWTKTKNKATQVTNIKIDISSLF